MHSPLSNEVPAPLPLVSPLLSPRPKSRNERAEKGEFPFTVIISDKVADRAENIHGDDEGARFVTREGPAQKGQAYRQVG